MKEQNEKQAIEEMAKYIYGNGITHDTTFHEDCRSIARDLYNAGYRKQIEGEWRRIEVNGKNYGQVYYQHKECRVNETQLFTSPHHFCPNCGAKMKGVIDERADC